MKISYNWLKQFLQIDWDASKTGELLTDLGLEVEGIETRESIKIYRRCERTKRFTKTWCTS